MTSVKQSVVGGLAMCTSSRIIVGAVHSSQLGRGARVCKRSTRISRQALNTQTGPVTTQDVLESPWAQPGYRGAYVSAQPLPVQSSIVAGITLSGILLTFLIYSYWGPWVSQHVPLMDTFMVRVPFIIPPLFTVAGIAHFTNHCDFCRFYPHKGAWGFWYLPGSPSFHVNWTGVAEIAGGVGCTLGALNLDILPDWLFTASAFGLFLLTLVVTPSNLYMWTHNAPGPLNEEQLDEMGGSIPWWGHASRAGLQAVLLSTFLGLALHNY